MEENTATITNLSHDGRGIAHIQGKATFIDGALPGEIVTFKYRKRHPKFDEGYVINIISTAPQRTQPKCIHFGICGGCSLQHIDSEEQIALKQQNLLEQLQHFGNVELEADKILLPILGPSYNYRHKARLGVKFVAKKNKVVVGFREKYSKYIADLNSCAILAEPVASLITPLKGVLEALSIKQHIPQIEIAVGEDITAFIIRHLMEPTEEDKIKLVEFGQSNNIHIYLQPDNLNSIYLLTPKDDTRLVSYTLPEFNLRLFFKPYYFSQVNPAINRKMITQAITFLKPEAHEQILDLFCGFGNFTLPLAKHAKQVTGIEGERHLVDQARFNAQFNGITNIEFCAADLTKPEKFGEWARQQYDKILLDPPRSGAMEFLPTLARMRAKIIVYISCNPATLARDAGLLVNTYGYQLTNAGVMDMFPHTSHVESLAVFKKKD